MIIVLGYQCLSSKNMAKKSRKRSLSSVTSAAIASKNARRTATDKQKKGGQKSDQFQCRGTNSPPFQSRPHNQNPNKISHCNTVINSRHSVLFAKTGMLHLHHPLCRPWHSFLHSPFTRYQRSIVQTQDLKMAWGCCDASFSRHVFSILRSIQITPSKMGLQSNVIIFTLPSVIISQPTLQLNF